MYLPAHKGLKILVTIALLGVGMFVLNQLRRPVQEAPPPAPPAPLEEVTRKQLAWEDDRFTRDGKPFTGILLDSYPDGKRKQRYQMKDGQNHGLTEEWYENGQQSTSTHWENGQRHGENVYWNPDGTVQKKQLWEHGKMLREEHP